MLALLLVIIPVSAFLFPTSNLDCNCPNSVPVKCPSPPPCSTSGTQQTADTKEVSEVDVNGLFLVKNYNFNSWNKLILITVFELIVSDYLLKDRYC